jgi:cytochrome c-type biogenesis protein CcmH/NrfG
MKTMSRPVVLGVVAAALACGMACNGCRRGAPSVPAVPDAVYRDAVTAFYTGLAAMQTSQDALARTSIEKVTTLVPDEPAGWANLGLLLLRQQEVEPAMPHLTRAAALAPSNGHIQRLLALTESRRGNLDASIAHWRKAVELDPADTKAAYALAQEMERQGGGDQDAEAQRVLQSLLSRTENLVARLDLARIAAKRGDAVMLKTALAPLQAQAGSWPDEVQQRFRTVEQAAASNPRAAAPAIAFLKNVLLRVPEYRRSLAAVSTPREEVGEPFERFVTLKNPPAQPAVPDSTVAFVIKPVEGVGNAVGFAGVFVSTENAAPEVLTADARQVRVGARTAGAFPGGARATLPTVRGVAAADLNYDYRTDLVLAGDGGLRILRQKEGGAFADVTAAAKLPASVTSGQHWGVWIADIDTEGDLDIVLSTAAGPAAVLRNNGDGSFAVQQPFGDVSTVRAFAWLDLDNDLVPDAAFLDGNGTLRTFLNLRGGQFREARGAADTGSDPRLAFTETGGRGRFGADVDNNGAIDLVTVTPTTTQIRLEGPAGTPPSARSLDMRAAAAADLDGDGRLDLVGTDKDGRAVVARNRGTKPYHYQVVRPKSATVLGDQRINSFGIGGEVEVRTGLHAQRVLITSPVVHIGLGEATRAEVARIFWPNGTIQSEFGLGADTTVAASQRLKGSCPWLFAWNGREMNWVTDLIWRSPLGLRINAQATASIQTTEDWVKLRGDQLAPRDGAYDLRITAELWETHFFDRVSLAYVDHPAGTEIFVDERFAVPAPALDVRATGPVRAFASARDDRDGDVTAIVGVRDDRHLDFAGRGAYQGITRDHFVELALPDDAPRTGPLWLIGQGWVHPTDSSINVAISQGDHDAPRSLTLEVADARGRFRTARASLGFPSGKDKTIRVDLAGLFPSSGPRRLRLRTNLEIYWDRLGWAAGRPDVRLDLRPVTLVTADLRYRGYSEAVQPDPSTPERARYRLAGTMPRWPDLEGYHTRFGDVRPLVGATDDRYVIMNAGDEMALTFAEAPPPGPGMTRDFIVIADGWEKDGDFNTTFSRTVLPLPTHADARYERAPTQLEDDPVYQRHRADFEQYHTRYVTPTPVRDALRLSSTMTDR